MDARDGDVALATAHDVARFFDCETGTEDEFRSEYRRLHLAQDSEVTPATAAATVVLTAGDAQVSMSEADYVGMLRENGLAPPADGKHSPLAVLYLARSAEKRGLVELAGKLMALRQVGRGLVLVRRPDGSFSTPKPVTTIKLARADEADQRAVAADVEAYFASEEPETP